MTHVEPERLALFALGEPVATPDESEHLAECALCVDELAALRHAAIAGRASIEVGGLEVPPESVWTAIRDELALGGTPGHAPAPVATLAPPASPAPPAPPVQHFASAAADSVPPQSTDRPHREPRRRRLQRAWALAAAFVLVAGAGLGVWAYTQRTALTEVATATLEPFPEHPAAGGDAVVEERSDGSLVVRVTVDADAAPDTFREVWLITADASSLISLGVLDASQQTFPIPKDVDLRDYVLVDVSEEPVDGDPAHSGDSIVRGQLSFL